MGWSTIVLVGSLLPAEGAAPKFAQLYMVDSADELDYRLNVFDREETASLEPDHEIVSSLINVLSAHHRLVHKFRIARQSLCTPGVSTVSIRFLGDDGGAHGFLALLLPRLLLLLLVISHLNAEDLT